MTALAAQPATEELLAQLGPSRGRLFKEDEVRAFVDYCVSALQAAPEEARDLVVAGWARWKHTYASNDWDRQSLDLDVGRSVSASMSERAVSWHGLPAGEPPAEDRVPAHVDLANEREVEEQYVVDKYGPVTDFSMVMYDSIASRLRRATRGGRNSGVVWQRLDDEMSMWSTPADVVEWAKRNVALVTVENDALVVEDRYGDSESFSIEGLVELAKTLAKLRAIADELLSAGWKPEDPTNTFTTYTYGGQHPGTFEPEVNPRARRRRRRR